MNRLGVMIILVSAAAGRCLPTLAVADFESIGCEADVGQAVAEILRTELSAGGVCRVIERGRLENVLAEQALGTSGMLDGNGATEAGALLGVDFIMVGSVALLGETYTISVREVNVATGGVIAAKSLSADEIDELPDLTRRLAELAQANIPQRMEREASSEAVELWHQGTAALEARQPEQALELFQAAITADPSFQGIYPAALRLALTLKQFETAERLSRQYLEYFPEESLAPAIRRRLAETEADR